MTPSRKFTALANTLATLTLLAAIALPLSAAAIWLLWNALAPYAAGNLQHVYDLTTLGVGARVAGFLVLLFGATIQAYGLLGVRRTFLEAAAGRAYSDRSLSGFKRFAWISVLMVFIGIAQQTGLIAIFSVSDPSHMGALSIQFGSNELKSLFTGALFVFVAHIFMEGKRAKDENEAFI
ncbi:MAG: hypothetical protein AAF224_10860 [Pseudomonadota bacterium]